MAEKSSKRKERKERKKRQPANNRPIHFDLEDISPLTLNQEIAFNSDNHLVMAGSAGCGKSFLACYFALEDYVDGNVKKIVIIRSAVPTRDMGFLPGSEKEKSNAYAEPYREIFKEILGRGDAYKILSDNGTVDFTTTSYLRGMTFRDCYIIVDETQNMDFQELNTVMTRVGENCRIIFCGDYKQADLKKNGMAKFMKILEKMDSTFEIIDFTTADIVRSELVKDYLIAAEKIG